MNEVFEMVAEVLEELRSEAGEREYSVCTKEAKNAAKELKKANQEYEKLLAEISGEQRELLEKYMDIVDHAHFQEEQRAYYQGMIDTIQIFEGLGILKKRNKVKELLSDTQLEESRIATEVILYADKICTDEETVRLHSHIESMKQTLQTGGSIGRKLDFIAQEMNREANTILSKANDLETSNLAINLKTEIEKVREQIQNIE